MACKDSADVTYLFKFCLEIASTRYIECKQFIISFFSAVAF